MAEHIRRIFSEAEMDEMIWSDVKIDLRLLGCGAEHGSSLTTGFDEVWMDEEATGFGEAWTDEEIDGFTLLWVSKKLLAASLFISLFGKTISAASSLSWAVATAMEKRMNKQSKNKQRARVSFSSSTQQNFVVTHPLYRGIQACQSSRPNCGTYVSWRASWILHLSDYHNHISSFHDMDISNPTGKINGYKNAR